MQIRARGIHTFGYHGQNPLVFTPRHGIITWWLQAITQTKYDLSSKVFCGFNLRAISQGVSINFTVRYCDKPLPEPMMIQFTDAYTVKSLI